MASKKLALRPHAFLNQLLHFDTPRLIIRTAGLSLCRETEFGVFFREQDPAIPVFTDPVSGLTIDAREISGIYLFKPKSGPPSFEIQFSTDGFALAVQPGTSEYSRMLIDRIANSFSGKAVTSGSISTLGAGAWLDEWGFVRKNRDSSLTLLKDRFQTRLSGHGFNYETTGTLQHRDTDRSVHRIISNDHHTYIFAHQSVIRK